MAIEAKVRRTRKREINAKKTRQVRADHVYTYFHSVVILDVLEQMWFVGTHHVNVLMSPIVQANATHFERGKDDVLVVTGHRVYESKEQMDV